MIKKIILLTVLLGFPIGRANATTWKSVLTSTTGAAQAGMAGYAMNLGSGTVSIFNSTAATITNTLTMPAGSTITASGAATLSGAVNLSGTTTVSSATVTDARLLAATISGTVKDRTLSAGTTWDYLLGGSSSTWTHAGLILQSTQCFVVAPTTASSTANFGGSSLKVTLTPKFANSIMRINFHGMLSNSNPSNDTCELTIFKNGTNMLGGTTDWIRYSMTNAAAANFPVIMGPYNDTSSASAITYQVYIRNSAGGNTCTLGTAGGNGLIVDEIGQ